MCVCAYVCISMCSCFYFFSQPLLGAKCSSLAPVCSTTGDGFSRGIWASGDKLQSLTHMDTRECSDTSKHTHTHTRVSWRASLRGDNVGKTSPHPISSQRWKDVWCTVCPTRSRARSHTHSLDTQWADQCLNRCPPSLELLLSRDISSCNSS